MYGQHLAIEREKVFGIKSANIFQVTADNVTDLTLQKQELH